MSPLEKVSRANLINRISGKAVRMDSKLISSNIAWFSRYEIIHETLM